MPSSVEDKRTPGPLPSPHRSRCRPDSSGSSRSSRPHPLPKPSRPGSPQLWLRWQRRTAHLLVGTLATNYESPPVTGQERRRVARTVKLRVSQTPRISSKAPAPTCKPRRRNRSRANHSARGSMCRSTQPSGPSCVARRLLLGERADPFVHVPKVLFHSHVLPRGSVSTGSSCAGWALALHQAAPR